MKMKQSNSDIDIPFTTSHCSPGGGEDDFEVCFQKKYIHSFNVAYFIQGILVGHFMFQRLSCHFSVILDSSFFA